MAQRETNLLPLILVLGGAALLYYSQSNTQSFTPIQPGQGYGGYVNNTGAAVYLDAAGNVIDSLGNLIAQINNINNNNNSGNNGSSDSDLFYGSEYDAVNGVNASYYCQKPENRNSIKCNPTITRQGLNPSMI